MQIRVRPGSPARQRRINRGAVPAVYLWAKATRRLPSREPDQCEDGRRTPDGNPPGPSLRWQSFPPPQPPTYPWPPRWWPSTLCSVRILSIPYKSLDQTPPPLPPSHMSEAFKVVVSAKLLGIPSRGGLVNKCCVCRNK